MPNDESKPSDRVVVESEKWVRVPGYERGPIHQCITPPSFVVSKLSVGGITINLQTGEVEAPSLEAASEAGRVFVDSVRGYLRTANERAEVVAYLRAQADYHQETDNGYYANALNDAADSIEGGFHVKGKLPLPEAPEGV